MPTLRPEKLKHDEIKVADQAFLIHHLIADCPDRTVIRELLKNAEENAVRLDPPGKVEWFIESQDGVRKLGLFNEGPGMSGDDLARLMDVASSGKTLATDENFGQGGKVSGLKVSPAGLIYRSCKNGLVSEIRLQATPTDGRPYPTYVKYRFQVDGGGYSSKLDVTESYATRIDRPINKDWTEVVLVGRSLEQDTVATLLGPNSRKNWLIREINQRFYRFPTGIAVKEADITSGQSNARKAMGLEELTTRYSKKDGGRYEDMSVNHLDYGPLVIRYCRLQGNWKADGPGNSRGRSMEAYGIGTMGDHVCLVWKNECYELFTGWSRISGPFGVTFGSANIAIEVRLTDQAPVKNNTYRDKLLRRSDDGDVRIDEFAAVVRANRPQWLIEYMDEMAQHNSSGANVMDRLQEFLHRLMVEGDPRPGVEPGGVLPGEMVGGSGGGSGGKRGGGHRAAVGKPTGQSSTGIPEVRFTDDPALLADMQGRAAVYRKEENLVLLNREHFRYLQEKEAFAEEQGKDAERRGLAEKVFDEEYMVEAGKLILQAYLFRNRHDWNDEAFEQALGMGSITIHLASPDIRREARRRVNQKIGAAAD
jgi:hypothetical protein